MAVCPVTLQRMQELNTGSTAAILCDQVYNKLTSLVRRTTLAPPPPLRGILKTGGEGEANPNNCDF